MNQRIEILDELFSERIVKDWQIYCDKELLHSKDLTCLLKIPVHMIRLS